MGFKRIRDLSDAARHGVVIIAECDRCGNVRALDAWTLDQLYRRKGWSRSIDRIGDRLRCSKCKPSVEIRLRLREDVRSARQDEGD
tara:strand:- start:1034 stop:1291 length:258 start_codon:yes stop_codon:yes gene_type:complete